MATDDAYLVHKVDQIRAQVADIVRVARDHRTTECGSADLGGCAGTEVWTLIRQLEPHVVSTLLFAAVAELAGQTQSTIRQS